MTNIVRDYVKRVASQEFDNFPSWDLTAPLPKLPVPGLKATLAKYLEFLEPIASAEQHARAEALVGDFQKPGGLGEELHSRLLRIAEQRDNWAYDWWLDDMYLKQRVPLPINSNPGMVFPRFHFSNQMEHLRFAARLISGILDYKVIIDARGLPIDRARHRERGQPLCMEQYYRLFCSYREPGADKDKLVTSASKSSTECPEYVIVIRNNQLFELNVVINGLRLSEDDLTNQLKRICKMAGERSAADDAASASPVGILTTQNRTEWAKARDRLRRDPTNRSSLSTIENCIFVLCLDQSVPIEFNHRRSLDETGSNARDDNSMALQMLHGQGTSVNSCNRWYDKTMQFIIGEDGACGLNYEHSPSDGIAVVQLIEHVLSYIEELRKRKLHRMNSICDLPYPRRLAWNLAPDSRADIELAATTMNKLIGNLDFYILRFTYYGKDFPKSQNMSPDSFIQLALQLTHYKCHGRLVSTYESASTRRYRLGRVDNIRAASQQALRWCRAMVGEAPASDEDKLQLLRNAMKFQTEYMVQTILGHGIDCYMLALKQIAEEAGMGVPALFEDETYRLANNFALSTSQILTQLDSFMGYGPVVPDGYGASYNPHPDFIVFCISSFHNCSETKSDRFALTLEKSLADMHELCQRTAKKAAAAAAVTSAAAAAGPKLETLLEHCAANGGGGRSPRNGDAAHGDDEPPPPSESGGSGGGGNEVTKSPRKLIRQLVIDDAAANACPAVQP